MFMNMDDGLIKAVQLWRVGMRARGTKGGRRISGNNIRKKYDRVSGVRNFANEVSRSVVAVLAQRRTM